MAVNWLKDENFNALALPRRDLHPGDVLHSPGRKASFDKKIGDVTMLFGGGTLPAITAGEPTANISRTISRTMKAGIGFQILGALLGAAGGDLAARTEYSRAAEVTISYVDVEMESIAVLALQSWLEAAGPPQTSRAAMVWLNDDEIAAVTAVLRTAKLSVVAKRQNGTDIELQVPEIQGIVSGRGVVEASSATTTRITYTGQAPVAFGVQAYRMIYEGNVSFGIEELRDVVAPDYSSLAATGSEETELSDVPWPED